jgi:hypothetical protein
MIQAIGHESGTDGESRCQCREWKEKDRLHSRARLERLYHDDLTDEITHCTLDQS